MKISKDAKLKIMKNIMKKYKETGVRFGGLTDERVEQMWKSIFDPISEALDEAEI